jgi:hypothetical protein
MRLGTIALGLASVATVGCINPAQEAWGRDMAFVGSVAQVLVRGRTAPLDERQLAAIVGVPDYRMTVLEFERLKVASPTWRDKARDALREQHDYFVARRSSPDHQRIPTTRDPGFGGWMLFVYDESLRFPQPIRYPPFSMGFSSGYHAYLFLVYDGKVIGSTACLFWAPRETMKRATWEPQSRSAASAWRRDRPRVIEQPAGGGGR